MKSSRWSRVSTAVAVGAVSLCAAAQAAHKASALRSYHDPETGVSLRYPAAWTEDMGSGYGGDPLTEYTTVTPNPPKARLRVGWSFPAGEADPGYLTVEDVSFAYAVLPARTRAACGKTFEGWSGEGAEDVVMGGVTYRHVSSSEAGLGHGWTFDLYTTFYGGRCLGFSVGSQTSHPDEQVPFSKADEAVSRDADAVMRSVRLLPVK